ncbi:MAG TPA: hypothetical protein VKT77_19920 [Chthonomonadaceae bacterium]|nr:hypothetical protein [Chthonomonadaceae bacterium]
MATIVCQRCNTVNENTSQNQPCRHCGTMLDAPMSAIDHPGGPANSVYNGADRVKAAGQAEHSAPAPRASGPPATSTVDVTSPGSAAPAYSASATVSGDRDPDSTADHAPRTG